ncbi:MAG: hypothetical protein HYW07_08475 [Candidatus Latescibacteria bacterium]|nr:hypothetical protein [Candidatus Latescibacterota bacterium]
MELRTLKKGSKTKIVLGVCCASPWTYSAWLLGTETAFLQKRIDLQEKIELPGQDSVSEKSAAKRSAAA